MQALRALEEAVACQRAGQAAQADQLFGRVLKKNPDYFDALNLYGVFKYQQNKPHDALKLLTRASQINPRSTGALNNLGAVLGSLGRTKDALAAFDRALALDGGNALALSNRGNMLALLDRFDDALASYDRLLAVEPDRADAHHNRGNVLARLGRHEEALASYDRALALNPRALDVVMNRGAALTALLRYAEALSCYDQVLAAMPNHVEAHRNRSVVLMRLDRPDEALQSIDRALTLKPDHAMALTNRGSVLQELGRAQEALACHREALRLDPKNQPARFNKAIALLSLGQYAEGWRGYESRWGNADMAAIRRTFAQPLWLGDAPVAGKTILLYAEQGFGDAIQFARYAPQVAALGATVVIEAPQPLCALFGSLAGVSQVVSRGQPLPAFDLQCPLLSLPLALQATVSGIPAGVPYLHAPPERIAAWRARLPDARKRIGLAWSGRLYPRNRSVPFELMRPLLATPDVAFVSLQQELPPDDLRAIADMPNLLHFGPELADFADTAALIANLDMVVSIDSAVAHLAGALGKPLCLMLILAADFRWLIGREDSPWYPTARLFRQRRTGDWSEAMDGVRQAVAALAGSP